MIIHLYGSDSYRRNKKLREFLAEYLRKYESADLLELDFEEDDEAAEKAGTFLSQPSMFAPSKVLVAKGGCTSAEAKEWAKTLKKYLEEPKIFVFISDSGKPVKAFDFVLKKPARSIFFDELTGEDLKRFVLGEAKARGLDLSPEAMRYFIGFTSSAEDASWNAVNELEKLSLIGLPQPVDLKALESLVEWTAKAAVFEGARAIMWGKGRAEKMKALEKLFLQKEAAAYIFNSLGFGARGRDAMRLADYDVKVKSGGLDYEEALLDFVLE